MIVSYKRTEKEFSILLDGLLHLHICKQAFIGLNAYIDESAKFHWKLDIYTLSETINIEYDSKEKWEAVLGKIEDCFYDK